MSCQGRGECIKQCGCVCYDDEEYEIPSDVCTCTHRHHNQIIGGNLESDIYCKEACSHNCELVKCHNYKICARELPQWVLDCHNGMCPDCAVTIGKVTFLDVKEDCPICLLNKDIVAISCKHKVCLDCWINWSETSTQAPLTCPLCRNPIWK